MSRGYTPRHAQTAGDLSFAVQFNDRENGKQGVKTLHRNLLFPVTSLPEEILVPPP